MRTFSIVLYYIAIFVLILFVGVVGYKLLFGTSCTIVGNYCVGDGWSIAGLAATILGVAATVLGILGAFALAAWWTGLDSKVRDQVDASLKLQEEKLKQREVFLNTRVENNLKQQEEKVTDRVNELIQMQEKIINKQIQEDLIRFSDRIAHDFSESEHVIKILDAQIKTLRSEYENIENMAKVASSLAVVNAIDGPPWKIEHVASELMEQYDIVDIPLNMVNKYLEYVDKFISSSDAEKALFMSSLKANGAPSADFQWFWEGVLRWQTEAQRFSNEEPLRVSVINGKVELYEIRIHRAQQNTAQEV